MDRTTQSARRGRGWYEFDADGNGGWFDPDDTVAIGEPGAEDPFADDADISDERADDVAEAIWCERRCPRWVALRDDRLLGLALTSA